MDGSHFDNANTNVLADVCSSRSKMGLTQPCILSQVLFVRPCDPLSLGILGHLVQCSNLRLAGLRPVDAILRTQTLGWDGNPPLTCPNSTWLPPVIGSFEVQRLHIPQHVRG
jgi:hypothetical protein